MKDTAKDFVIGELENLRVAPVVAPFERLEDEIHRLILSKKFRKYSANDALRAQIKKAIDTNVKNNEPINITFCGGSFKLWRLDEAPEVDLAELFALMYYTQWMKPILAIYKPGVVFDFFMDDIIMERICNYTREEVLAFQSSFRAVMDFVKGYVPANLKFQITPVSSCFKNEAEFWKKVDQATAKFTKTEDIVLSPEQIACIDLNYRPAPDEILDPLFHQENARIHDAYLGLADRHLYRDMNKKILAISFHRAWDVALHIGSTKDSIVKYWVGTGVLRPKGDGLMTTILSPNQLSKAEFTTHDISIPGLDGKNFSRIRILK